MGSRASSLSPPLPFLPSSLFPTPCAIGRVAISLTDRLIDRLIACTRVYGRVCVCVWVCVYSCLCRRGRKGVLEGHTNIRLTAMMCSLRAAFLRHGVCLVCVGVYTHTRTASVWLADWLADWMAVLTERGGARTDDHDVAARLFFAAAAAAGVVLVVVLLLRDGRICNVTPEG